MTRAGRRAPGRPTWRHGIAAVVGGMVALSVACGPPAQAQRVPTRRQDLTATAPAASAPAPGTMGLLERRARRDPRYRRLVALARASGLTIGIRRSSLGRRALTQGAQRGGSYRWDDLTDADDPVLEQHLIAFTAFWPRFPAAFLKEAGVTGVLFAKNLRWHGMQVYGFEVTDGVLLVNLSLGGKVHYPGDEAFHYALTHELFHLVQNRLLRDRRFIDYQAWTRLNPPGVTYHSGGTMGMLREAAGRRDLWTWLHAEHPAPGFVSRYAMSDQWHDTTETFCALFIASRYHKARAWSRGDRHLRAKLSYLQAALRRVHPGLTEAYFEKLHARPRRAAPTARQTR